MHEYKSSITSGASKCLITIWRVDNGGGNNCPIAKISSNLIVADNNSGLSLGGWYLLTKKD